MGWQNFALWDELALLLNLLQQVGAILPWSQLDDNNLVICGEFRLSVHNFIANASSKLFFKAESALRLVLEIHKAIVVAREVGILKVTDLVLIKVRELIKLINLAGPLFDFSANHFMEQGISVTVLFLLKINFLTWAVDVNEDLKISIFFFPLGG